MKEKAKNLKSIFIIVTLIAIFTFVMSNVYASSRQSLTTTRRPLSSTTHTYEGVTKAILSELGEMVGFEYPAGYEHIYIGTLLEGYSISYTANSQNYHVYSLFDNTSGSMTSVTYNVLEDSSSTLVVEAVSRTTDNLVEIKNRFMMNKSESKISISMTIKNIGDADLSNIRLKRICDLDLDTGSTYGWAEYYDYFDLTSNGILTYTESPPEGREAHSMTTYGVPTPTWFGADDWDDWYQRDNTDDGFTYPVYGDYTTTLSWDLSDLNPGQTSTSYTAIYSMGIVETNKPTAKVTNSVSEDITTFSTTQDVFVKGDKFPASQSVMVYVVPDRGWANGDTIGSDVSGVTESITTDASGLLPLTAIWQNPLVTGNYDVVVDVNDNGIFDYEYDAVVGEGSVGFTAEKECVPIVNMPHVFIPGTPAKAEEVNENFQLLYDTINDLACIIQELEQRIETLEGK